MLRSMVAAIALVGAPVTDARPAITAAMTSSAAGWNAGDLDRFMAVYADDAIFVTPKGLLRGKADIAAHYRPSFTDGSNRRGTLTFRMLAFRPIDERHELLFARWTLTPADPAKVAAGMTTLVFERRGNDWLIISDHSS